MKLYIAYPSTTVIEKLSDLLSGIAGVEVAGHALTAGDALPAITALKPDLVILDLNLVGGARGRDLVSRIRPEVPEAVVVVLTHELGPDDRARARALAADYLFDKASGIGDFYETVQRLAAVRVGPALVPGRPEEVGPDGVRSR